MDKNTPQYDEIVQASLKWFQAGVTLDDMAHAQIDALTLLQQSATRAMVVGPLPDMVNEEDLAEAQHKVTLGEYDVCDGGLHYDADGVIIGVEFRVFHNLRNPTDAEVQAMLAKRVTDVLRQGGLLDKPADGESHYQN